LSRRTTGWQGRQDKRLLFFFSVLFYSKISASLEKFGKIFSIIAMNGVNDCGLKPAASDDICTSGGSCKQVRSSAASKQQLPRTRSHSVNCNTFLNTSQQISVDFA